MVVFTCNHCGESLQKPRVEKHFNFVCRKQIFITCVDCFKDFKGDEYVAHLKCVTENERYGAKGFVQHVKKGDAKQESWMEMIKSIINCEPNLSAKHKDILNIINNHPNVPRKKAKFINFLKSTTGGRINLKEVEDVWDIIEKFKNKEYSKKDETENMNQQNGVDNERKSDSADADVKTKKKKKRVKEPVQNGSTMEDELTNDLSKKKKKKEKKRNLADDTDISIKKKKEDNEESNTNSVNDVDKKDEIKRKETPKRHLDSTENGEIQKKKTKVKNEDKDSVETNKLKDKTLSPCEEDKLVVKSFSFEDIILNILNSKTSISLKKLEKKVLNTYKKEFGEIENLEKMQKKFHKKLKKLNNIQIDNNIVMIM